MTNSRRTILGDSEDIETADGIGLERHTRIQQNLPFSDIR